jgi:hypothetical protein
MKLQTALLLVASFMVSFIASVQAQTVNPIPMVTDDWRFSATVSAWAPASWTTDTMGNRSAISDSSINQNISGSGGMAMFTLEAHKGDWGLMEDLVYWQSTGSSNTLRTLRGRDNTLDYGYNAAVTQTMLTSAVTYTAIKSSSLYIDGLLGARYISSTTTISDAVSVDHDGRVVRAHAGNPSYVNQTTDPVIGFKGRMRVMDSSWFIPFYVDGGKGPGSNNGTWQALIGVGDVFSWGDVTLAYRAMGFHLKDNTGSSNWTNAGPQLSATVNF